MLWAAFMFVFGTSVGAEEPADISSLAEDYGANDTADSLPYDDNSFDIVTCIQSFHHYPDPDKSMLEVYRVLKPNGLYILSDTGVGGIGAWFDNNILFKLMQSGDCHTGNRKDLARRMEKNGFRKVKSKQLKGFIYTVIGQK